MTLSVLGRDPNTGEFGICSFTSSPAHGQRCPNVKKGIGVVASQGITHRSHGDTCMALMGLGIEPEHALYLSKLRDQNIDARQIALLPLTGHPTAFTGAAVRDSKGHICGDDFIVAGNFLKNRQVLAAAAEAFVTSSGELALRLLDACAAAEHAGGEHGGSLSSFLIVTHPDELSGWGNHVDLRIDYMPHVLSGMRVALRQYNTWVINRMMDPLSTLAR